MLTGETSTITYSVTTNEADNLGDGTLANAFTGAPNCPDPAITDPDDPDFNADCAAINYIAAFTVTKTSNPPHGSEVQSGDTITYNVAIENTGALDFTDFSFDDNLSDVLDDTTLTGDTTVSPTSAGSTTLNDTTLTFDGDVPVGQTVTVNYAVTVNQPDQLGNEQIRNLVYAPFSNCAGPNDPNCMTTHTIDPNNLADTGRNIITALVLAVGLIGTGIYVYIKRSNINLFGKV